LLKPFPSPINPLESFKFNADTANTSSFAETTALLDDRPQGKFPILPQDAEVIFFFGDLNFRLKSDSNTYGTPSSIPQPLPNRTEILRLINEGSINQLLDMDELGYLMRSKHGVLSQFLEAKIEFLPSYKFNLIGNTKKRDFERIPSTTSLPRSISHDLANLPRTHSSKSLNANPPPTSTRIYSSKRLPAYCDRILYFADHRYILTPLRYTCKSIEFSDHDPVMGVYHLERVEGEGKVFVRRGGVMGVRLMRVLGICWKYVLGVAIVIGLMKYLW
jgi:hypothetical protein